MSLCSPVRPAPPPYAPLLPWRTNFQDRSQALSVFDEGWGQVTTAGSLACRRTDHLRYNASFDGYGVATGGIQGLRILMNNVNGSSCHRDSQVATGHLLTPQYLPASGGRIEMLARIGYGTDPATGYRSEDAFSCLGLYVHPSVSEYGYRNEISMCVSSADTSTVRMGIWVGDDGDKQHAKQATLPVDLAQSFHLYSIEWFPRRIQFAVDDAAIWVVEGQSLCAGSRAAEVDAAPGAVQRLPFESMSVRIILRPRGREYQPPPTHMDVAGFAYWPLLNPEEDGVDASPAIDTKQQPLEPGPEAADAGQMDEGADGETGAEAGQDVAFAPQAPGLVGAQQQQALSSRAFKARPSLLVVGLGIVAHWCLGQVWLFGG